MHADNPGRVFDRGSDLGYRAGGRIGRQDNVRPHRFGQLGERFLFQLHILQNGLDNEIAVTACLHVSDGDDPPHDVLDLVGGHLALFDPAHQAFVDLGHRPVDDIRVDVEQNGLDSVLGQKLGDARPHRSGA